MKNKLGIEQLIQEKLADLPANQKKVAEFFLTRKNLAALLPVKAIAAEAQVSEASIVRFAQSLGFEGFKELREKMSRDLKQQLTPTEIYQAAAQKKSLAEHTLQAVARNVINNIQNTVNGIEPELFSQVVNRIIKARKIYCLGLELSSHLARLLTFHLRLYTYDAYHLSLDFLHFREQIALLTPDDLLIVFSFSPYSRETIEAIEAAKAANVPSIAFTDKRTAPAAPLATHSIIIKTDNILFSNSIGAVVVVFNAIMTELNFRDRKRTLKALDLIEKNILDERYFILE